MKCLSIDYFGERAREFVIDNPNKIADMVDGDVIPVPDGNYPVIEGSTSVARYLLDTAHKPTAKICLRWLKSALKRSLTPLSTTGFQ